MARGAPDYWSTSYLSKVTFAEGQTQWYEYAEDDCAWNTIVDLIDYTVPADTILVVNTGYVMSEQPMASRCIITLEAVDVQHFYFSINYNFPYSDSGIYRLTEGESIKLSVVNHDDETLIFTGALVGYEEIITQL